MNFEFLKNLRGLGNIYENCANAEKLAKRMPTQSVFTSRKSAELLAKFIYMAAHKQEMEGLSFADVLADPTVRKFVSNRDIMDAFHYIRKSGNQAAHGDSRETSEDAISVLQRLHYVVGETACRLKLIKSYPDFEPTFDSFSDAKYADDVNEEDIDQKALEMFLSYVEEFNAQREREQYTEDYDCLAYSVESNVEMHEYLEFKRRPKQQDLTEYLQRYLSTLLRLSTERSPEKAEELELSHPVTLDAKLIFGQKQYSSKDKDSFALALKKELPEADGFTIDLFCTGVLREFYNEEDEEGNHRFNMIRKDAAWKGAGMLDTLEAYKRRNAFTYKLAAYFPDSGEFMYEKIVDGKEIDVLDSCDPSILEKAVSRDWWSLSLILWAKFDFEKYADKLNALHDIVRENIPQSEVEFCEETWAEGDPHILCNGIQWENVDLNEVQRFLDKINAVLLPIKDEVEAGGEGTWGIIDEFKVATWDWTDEGFKVIGTCY